MKSWIAPFLWGCKGKAARERAGGGEFWAAGQVLAHVGPAASEPAGLEPRGRRWGLSFAASHQQRGLQSWWSLQAPPKDSGHHHPNVSLLPIPRLWEGVLGPALALPVENPELLLGAVLME